MSSDSNKYKKPKQKSNATTNPGTSISRNQRSLAVKNTLQPQCPLLAKDSEWADILQNSTSSSAQDVSEEEEVLQLVECEDGPQLKPLAIMFPGLLDKDPQTLQGMLTRVMSTTEVTRHLVELGQKANFAFMRKADRLIPPEKQWMESLIENNSSYCSVSTGLLSNCISSDYEEEGEITPNPEVTKIKKKRKYNRNMNSQRESRSQDFNEEENK